jgi:hypothetical protein
MGSMSYSIVILAIIMATQSIGLACVLKCVRHVHIGVRDARKQVV